MAGKTPQQEPSLGWLYRPRFRDEWRRSKLFPLARWTNGMAFRNIHFSPTGRPIIKIAEMKEGISGQTQFTAATYDEAYLVRDGDMLFSWSGQPESSIDVFWWRGAEGWLNQHIFKVEPDRSQCEPLFFYYVLKYLRPNFIGIARNKQTTGLGHVTQKDLEAIEVVLPDRSEQCAIARILGTLDDKIELLRRMNETLEAMARAIFKSWFVDFEPVLAKAEGRDPGLLKPIADLFPDRFEDSELGEIPEGWEVKSFGDLLQLAYGKALREDNRRPGQIPVFGSNGQVGWHDQELAIGPGIIVGRKGHPGVVTWAPTDFFAIDTTFYVVPKPACRSLYFLFYALQSHNLASLGADSAVPGLNRNLVYLSLQVLPPQDVLDAFDARVKGLFDRQYHNERESRTLAGLRDALLPKLISGEIRIEHPEGIVAGETP